MKVRITQRTQKDEAFLMPGDVLDVDEEQARVWIEDGRAVMFDEQPPIKKAKSVKAVDNGNG
jgi:hypothetical protein